MGVKGFRLEGMLRGVEPDGFLAVRGLAEELRALAVERTPVEDGVLREGWRVGNVERVGNRYRVVVENDVPYASHVEVGHRAGNRWVPGRFFLREAEDELIRREGGSRC